MRLTLVCSVTGAVIVALDGTVLSVVQPALQRDLDASVTQVQWTSTGYLIAVASLLVLAGRLGDRYGHLRIFAIGMLGFGAASAGIGLAPGIGWVIGLRVAQGVFGALLQPATLGMLRAAYPPDRLGTPIALRTSAIGVAAAAGPLVGGALATPFGWRSVFWLNVVPAVVLGALALALAREARVAPDRGGAPRVGLDLPGAGLLAITSAGLVHALAGASGTGWPTAAGTALTVIAGAAFVRHLRRTPDPLVPPAVLRSGTVAAALAVLVAASAAMFGTLFVATYFLQDVLGLDPLRTALWGLPGPAMMVLGAPLAAVSARRHGPRRTVGGGMVLLALGIGLFAGLDRTATAPAVGACFVLIGAGFGAVMMTATAVVVRHAAVAHAGVAGGLQQTAMNIGPMLGVAAATALMAREANGAAGSPLLPLAAVAALGAFLAIRLPAPVLPERDP
ncbi:MFS transporter [Streptomyces cavernae]|uniref:MFS transporter n=1 Tax=Streptomyces cavernae TaxID=2259034 RepID=UPI000FEB762C|nr:MFS transporter [Streptomyces cavernae]